MSFTRPSAGLGHLLLGLGACVVFSVGAFHCGNDSESEFPPGDAGTNSEGGPIGFGDCDGTPCNVAPDGAIIPACGDGRIVDKEGCDDGNTKSGDGCDATCNVEPGWVCPNPGLRCQASKCGDGLVAGAEECDYPPGAPVAGCSATTCRIQTGFDCDPKTLVCNAVVCGDGKVQRGEGCEDGNDLPFDGCFKCQKEPSCTNGVCKAVCGDGQRFATEGCDDGNTRSGDGCSSTCQVEVGFKCADILSAPADSIDQPVLVRDFIGHGRAIGGAVAHDDFNQLNGNGVLGMVQNTLTGGKPTLTGCPVGGGDCTSNPGYAFFGAAYRNVSTAANFAQWYRDVAGVNVPSAITIALARQMNGTYTWDSANPAVNGGKDFFDPIGAGGWVGLGKESLAACGPDRNVSFTSETHFWFEYQGGERFDFAGDDDTWIFVNGKLVVDLGGLHTPKTGFFTLDNAGTATFSSDMPQSGTVAVGLVKGGVYEVVMFQAERNECGSNFRITLKDFNRPTSNCASTCGDGIVASDELCDDGKNDGSYGGCMPGCKIRGPYCGDGRVDPIEECDDGNTNNNDGCTNTCKVPRVN